MPKYPPSGPPSQNKAPNTASLKPFAIMLVVLVLMLLSRGKHNQFEKGTLLASVPVMELSTGKIVELSKLTAGDAPVALHFFATWCGSCMREWDDIPIISQRHGDDFKVILVGVDTPLNLKKLTAQKPTSLPVFVGGSEIEGAARIKSYPYTVFVTPELGVLFDYPGALTASGFAQARAAQLSQRQP